MTNLKELYLGMILYIIQTQINSPTTNSSLILTTQNLKSCLYVIIHYNAARNEIIEIKNIRRAKLPLLASIYLSNFFDNKADNPLNGSQNK